MNTSSFSFRFSILRFLIPLLFCGFFSVSQTLKSDSLITLMHQTMFAGDLDAALTLADSSLKYSCIDKPESCDGMYVYLSWYKARLLMVGLKFDECRLFLKEVLKRYETDTLDIEEGYFYARLIGELGATYHGEMNFEKTKYYYLKALQFSPIDFNTELMIYNGLCKLHNVFGALDSAVYYSDKIIDMQREKGINENPSFSNDLMYNAMIKGQLGEFELAEELANEALSLWKHHNRHMAGYAYGLSQFAHIYVKWKKFDKALRYSREATKIYENSNGRVGWYYSFLSADGYNHYKLNQMDSAYFYFIQVPGLAKTYTASVCSFMSLKSKEIFTNKNNKIRSEMFSMLERFDNQYPNYNIEMYDYINFYKGYSMKSLKNLKEECNNSTNPEIRASFSTWKNLRTQYYQYLSIENQSKDTINRYAEQLDSMEVFLYRKLNLPETYSRMEYTSSKEIANSLEANEIALEFIRFKDNETGKSKYGAMLLRSEDTFPIYIPIAEEATLENLLKHRFAETDFEYTKRIYEGSDSLYKMIWEPILSQCNGAEKVYVSYTGLLHGVANDVILFLSETDSTNMPKLFNVNSTSEIESLKNKTCKVYDWDALIFGGISYYIKENKKRSKERGKKEWNYLLASEKEVEGIKSNLEKKGNRPKLYRGSMATEQVFKNEVNRKTYQLIHIATHGLSILDNKNEAALSQNTHYAESGLVMAGASDLEDSDSISQIYGDGILSAPEIASLKMNETQLVVLSACESGLGNVSNTDEVYGLQRAFKIAGAGYVLYTLWTIPDKSTLEFMLYFYKRLGEGVEVNEAFNQTKIFMKSHRKYHSPYYWGAFQLMY